MISTLVYTMAHIGLGAAGTACCQLRSGVATLLCREPAKMSVPNELPALLVPEAKPERSQAGYQRDGRDLLKQPVALVTSLQVVVGNARAQVVDVMKADVARQPLQHLRQLVVGAAAQCGRRVVPVVAAFPINAIELMLHVEQPESDAAGDRHRDRLHEQIGHDTEDPAEQPHSNEEHQVQLQHRAAASLVSLG